MTQARPALHSGVGGELVGASYSVAGLGPVSISANPAAPPSGRGVRGRERRESPRGRNRHQADIVDSTVTGHETTLSIDTVLDAVFESCAGQAVPQVERTLCDLTAQAHPPVDARMVRTFAEAISAGRRVCIRWRRGQAVWTIDRSETLSRHGGPHGTSDTCPSVDL